ncbi:GGDEF domain-containing protein [Cognatiluteimonas weifangensis]|uniref:EAL domain-containing protein n=1 Tax=Cognatiluteimonas weifangensis TaxID=2303539 RepID=A0A372DIU7_9GAMM|nr:GGDEF domain-containing protein [Luteimonas weifangensis]RFP59439.1 EAL domain-containing protein [Luteimonas weifangensis]
MQTKFNPGSQAQSEVFLAELLAARTPLAILQALARALPDAPQAQALWSSSWPQSICSDPPGVSGPEIARAVREVSARRAGAHPDPRYSLLCDDPDGGVALLHLESPWTTAPQLRRLCAAAGARMAEVLTRERLHSTIAQLENAEHLQRALFAIGDLAASDLDMPEMLRGLHRIVSGLMYAENFYIALYDPAGDSLRFAYYADTVDQTGPDPDQSVPLAQLERCLTWYLIRDGQPLMGTTAQLREQVSGPLTVLGTDSSDWLGVPMQRDGRVYGVLVVQSYLEGSKYTHADMSLLAFVAEHVLTALERRGAREELERRVEERTCQLAQANRELSREVAERERGERLQAALYQIAALAGSAESSDDFYARVHAIVGELIDAQNIYIALLSDDGATIEFAYAADRYQQDWSSRPFGRGLTEYVLRTRQPLIVDRAQVDALVEQGHVDPGYVASPTKSWLGAPLLVDGKAIGVVAVRAYEDNADYDTHDAELLTFVSHQIASTLQRRRAAEALQQANLQLEERVQQRTRELREQIAQRELAEAQLKHQVMHDPLTGLPNRVYLRDRIERALSQLRREPGRSFALLYIDVDRFKQINDSLGHLVGDDVLKEVAHRLGHAVREPDVVARLSGDEFAILLERVDLPKTASRVAQRVIAALQRPMEVAGQEVETSASIGVTVCDGNYVSTDEVLRDADIALYRAKEQGRNCFVMFDEQLHHATMHVLALERELREGLRHDQFMPWFQPLVRLQDAAVVGYEALLRWQHPQRGVLAPADFLQVAEDSGQLEAIDWRIFQLACEAGRTLLDDGQFVTLNVSPGLIRREDFDSRLLRVAAAAGLAPERLRIEITESTLIGDPEAAVRVLQRLRAACVESALDDFGTSHASLASLHSLPLRMIKIDRSYIAALGDAAARGHAVVGAMIALARSLDIEVLAEGIETQAQHDALLAMGCHYGQGFLYDHAQPLAHWTVRA